MTTEPNDIDPDVSDAYRELASERTPPELDDKILSMAAANSRSPYGRARAWIRPVAWAATIGLSLAFILEMSQLPERPEVSVDSDASTFEEVEETAIRDETPDKPKDERQLAPEPDKRVDAPALQKASPPPVATKPAPVPQGDSVSADFQADNIDLLQEAERRARMQSGSARAPAAAAEIAITAEEEKQLEHCDADARATAASWYRCIQALREDDDAGAANEELDALIAEFPNFQVPDQSR